MCYFLFSPKHHFLSCIPFSRSTLFYIFNKMCLFSCNNIIIYYYRTFLRLFSRSCEFQFCFVFFISSAYVCSKGFCEHIIKTVLFFFIVLKTQGHFTYVRIWSNMINALHCTNLNYYYILSLKGLLTRIPSVLIN